MSDEPRWWWTTAMRQAWEERKRRAEEAETRRRQAEERARREADDDNAGFAIGLATGVPVPFTPMAIIGATLHNSMSQSYASPSREDATPTTRYEPSPSYSSSYDSGSSSSSYDSGSSSSSSSSSYD